MHIHPVDGSTGKQLRYLSLDGWRGISACMIAFMHMPGHLDIPIINNASLFVDLFFVLSGFVLSATYQEKLLAGFGVGRFIFLRWARIYPLHFAVLALYLF